MAESFSGARIVWNSAARGDLNMRVFEVLSAGAFLLTESLPVASGQSDLFRVDEHLAVYDDQNLLDRIAYYLERPDLRREIAAAGRKEAHAHHTYDHRVEELLEVMSRRRADPQTVGRSPAEARRA